MRIILYYTPSVSTRSPRGFCILCSSIRTQLEEKFKSINGELYKVYTLSKKEAEETAETHTRTPNNLKLTQLTKVLLHNQLADKAKVRLPTFSHNLHLDIYSISLTFSNMYEIPTCRLFENTRTYPFQITHQPPLLAIAREKWLYLSMRTTQERRTCHPVHIAPQKTKHPC